MAAFCVIVALVAIWLGGGALGMSSRGRVVAALALWACILAVTGLASDSVLARWLGGSVRHWTVSGGVLALAILYRGVVNRAYRKAGGLVPVTTSVAPDAAPETATPYMPAFDPDASLSDGELERYSRHIMLRELGGPGQRALRRAKVLIIGAGGLGSPVALYLAAAGIGRLTLADDDHVSLSNLQRQILFATGQEGQSKARTAAARLRALNPEIEVTALERRVTGADAALVSDFDLIIDGTDSFAGRAAINAVCVRSGIPLLTGAIAQWEGQVTVYDPARDAPCLSCLFPTAPGSAPSCAEAGIVGALPGVIGSIMALEAVKLLTGAGQDLRGRLFIYDGLYGDVRVMRLSRRAGCAVCGQWK